MFKTVTECVDNNISYIYRYLNVQRGKFNIPAFTLLCTFFVNYDFIRYWNQPGQSFLKHRGKNAYDT